MGNSSSLPQTRNINADTTQIIVTGQGLSKIPYQIPTENQITYLNLSKNKIKELPKNLNSLIAILLSNNELKDLSSSLTNRFLSYKTLQIIDLSNNQLKELPQSVISMKSIQRINLLNNKFSFIDFSSSFVNHIDLGHNLINEFPKVSDCVLSLNLDRNSISKIDVENSTMVRLCVSKNLITSISDRTCFNSLTVLDISHNKISNLPNISQMCPMVQHFDASFNQITEIPPFPESIVELLLINNHISEIPQNLFQNSTNLQNIDFSQNLIRKVPSISKLQNLQYFNISENEIEEIDEFSTITMLKLYAQKNKLKSVPKILSDTLFDYLFPYNSIKQFNFSDFSKNVRRIDLSNNGVETVPGDLFECLPELSHLYLSNNNLSCLPKSISKSNLLLLNISGNNFEGTLQDMPLSLEHLFIANCNLTELPASLENSQDLVELCGCGNFLRSVPTISSLLNMNLSRNQLIEVPNLPPKIATVNLSCNRIRRLPTIIDSPMLTSLDVSSNEIEKIKTEFLTKKLLILKLSNNPMSGLIDFVNSPNLKNLDISSTSSITFINLQKKCRIIHSNNINLPKNRLYRNFIANNDIGYAQQKGAREILEDLILCRSDFMTFGMYDCHNGGKTGEYALNEIQNLSPEKFTSTGILKSISRTISSAQNQQCFDGASFSIVLFDQRITSTTDCSKKGQKIKQVKEIIVIKNGNIPVYLCDDEGKIVQISEENSEIDPPLKKSSKESSSNINTNANNSNPNNENSVNESVVGSFLIFGVGLEPVVLRHKIRGKQRWLLILSTGITSVLSIDLISKISLREKNATEFANDLRNMAYCLNGNLNLSSFVIDLSIYRK